MLYILFTPISPNIKLWISTIPHFDKIAHFILFGIWAFLLTPHLLSKSQTGYSKAFVIGIILGIILALGTELIQAFIGYRSAELMDLIADLLGLGLGTSIFAWINNTLFKPMNK